MSFEFQTDEQFLDHINLLCEWAEARDPLWAAKMKENPVVWAPHPLYDTCCEFPADHPIHWRSMRGER